MVPFEPHTTQSKRAITLVNGATRVLRAVPQEGQALALESAMDQDRPSADAVVVIDAWTAHTLSCMCMRMAQISRKCLHYQASQEETYARTALQPSKTESSIVTS